MRPTVKTAVLGALGLAVIVFCCALFVRLTWMEGSAPAKVITVYAWEDYLSKEILDEFTSTTGIAVRVVTFGTIDESLATLETKANDFDLALVDEVSLEPLASSKLIRPFNDKLLSDVAARSKFADPLGMGIPYLWGCTGLAFDKRKVPEATQSISLLWDPRLRGRVAILEDMFETMDLLFLHAGYPSNSTSIAALDGARRSAHALAENAVRFGDTFENIEALRRGEVDIIQAYSGDVFTKAGHDPNIVFFLPKEGFSLWADYLVLSSGSRHVAEAHALVEFLSRKDVSMRSAEVFHYDSPMAETNELATRKPHGASRLLPPADKRRQRARFEPAGPATGEYQKIFSELKRLSP